MIRGGAGAMTVSLGWGDKAEALDYWVIRFANNAPPAEPTVLLRSAEQSGSAVTLSVQSWLAETQTVRFRGSLRRPTDRDADVGFSYDVTLTPGFNLVRLPLGAILDAVVDVDVGGFKDKIYIGSGSWFDFDSAISDPGSHVELTLPDCSEATNLTDLDLALFGCAQISGYIGVNGWGGIARTLNPNDLPVDVCDYGALTFFAQGDGKTYRVNLETQSVRDLNSTDFHVFAFTTSSAWQQYVIPLSLFRQQGWDPAKIIPLTCADIVSVAWATLGAPLDSINLAVDRVAFTNSTIVSGTTRLGDTQDTAGPYRVTTQVVDETGVAGVDLWFSVDPRGVYQRVPMQHGADGYTAEIPGQRLGTDVRYYVAAHDGDGNLGTAPVGVPAANYRFQVRRHPYLLVDDFWDTDPRNALGQTTGPFRSDTGAAVRVAHQSATLGMTYDVLTPGSYGGYYSLLGDLDLTARNAVTLLVKGDSGGERVRVGLRDNDFKETKILIDEYLPAGITTFWQKVTIPLAAFTRVGTWGEMENINVDVESRIGSGAGSIHLDDLKFEYLEAPAIVIDNFNNGVGETGVGTSHWTWSGGGASLDTAYDPINRVGGQGAGLRIAYEGISASGWGLAVIDLAGLDASGYAALSFYIKGARGNERPNLWLVSDDHATEARGMVDIEDYLSVTTAWQQVTIPLAVFAAQGVDVANLSYLQFGFEWELMQGAVYVDEIVLGDAPWRLVPLQRGPNYVGAPDLKGGVAYPCGALAPYFGAASGATGIWRFNAGAQRYEHCADGGFDVAPGEGLLIAMTVDAQPVLGRPSPCGERRLVPGVNLVSFRNPSTDLGCLRWLGELGQDLATAIQRFVPSVGRFETCAWLPEAVGDGAAPGGSDFPIEDSGVYMVHSAAGGTLPEVPCER